MIGDYTSCADFAYKQAVEGVLKAVEHRVHVLSASTNGPTYYANSLGVIKRGVLPLMSEGYIIIETKI